VPGPLIPENPRGQGEPEPELHSATRQAAADTKPLRRPCALFKELPLRLNALLMTRVQELLTIRTGFPRRTAENRSPWLS
jgi:hypothetical protein